MQRYESKYVVCPFYHGEKSLILYCEGINEDTTLMYAFLRGADMRGYKVKYCCSMEDHKKCPLAKILYEKYEDGGI